MRKAFIAVLLLAVGATGASAGVESPERDLGIVKALRPTSAGGSAFGTANSNCAGAACDTVWIGHSNAGPSRTGRSDDGPLRATPSFHV